MKIKDLTVDWGNGQSGQGQDGRNNGQRPIEAVLEQLAQQQQELGEALEQVRRLAMENQKRVWEEQLLTAEEVAEMLKIGIDKVYKNKKLLGAVKRNGIGVRFIRGRVMNYVVSGDFRTTEKGTQRK